MSKAASVKAASVTSTSEDESVTKEYDVVLKFLEKSNVDKEEVIHVIDENGLSHDINNQLQLPKKVLRKLDIYILPLMCCVYFLQFLDKTLLNYAAVMGIKDNLVGNQYSNLSTIFNAAYIFGEPLSSVILQRYSLSRTLASFIILWGVTLACHCACHTYAALMIVRVLLGFFESASATGLIIIGTMYYTKAEQSQRIGYWASQAGVATIVGGFLSFVFQFITTSKFQSWQILFLVFGIITIVFGVFLWLYLPDNITNAWFLDEQEKRLVVEHIRSNQTGVENKTFKWSQIRELLFHDQFTWIQIFAFICSQIVTGAVGAFSTSITATFGYSNKVSALLQMPSGVVIILCIIIPTQLIAKFGAFTWVHVSMYVPSVVGAIMLITLDLDRKIGNLFGLYLLYSGSCAITLFYIWNGVNTAGHTKKLFRNALVLMALGISNIIGPQLFQDYSYPRYIPAKIVILVTQAVSIPLTLLVGYMSKRENDKRDKEALESGASADENHEFLDLTDIENKNFRYLY